MKKTLGFIGGGRITRIFLQSFHNTGFALAKIAVYDISNDVLTSLQKHFLRWK